MERGSIFIFVPPHTSLGTQWAAALLRCILGV